VHCRLGNFWSHHCGYSTKRHGSSWPLSVTRSMTRYRDTRITVRQNWDCHSSRSIPEALRCTAGRHHTRNRVETGSALRLPDIGESWAQDRSCRRAMRRHRSRSLRVGQGWPAAGPEKCAPPWSDTGAQAARCITPVISQMPIAVRAARLSIDQFHIPEGRDAAIIFWSADATRALLASQVRLS